MADSSVRRALKARHKAEKRRHSRAERKADRHKSTKIAVFRYAYYAPAFKYFVEQVLDCEYLDLPKSTKRTAELGIQVSADDVCAPFKDRGA